MRFTVAALTLAFILAMPTLARAQEPTNEIVAQVNNGIISRADYLDELAAFKEELKGRMQGKSDAEVEAEFENLRASVLDAMIDELLLVQRARELGADVEAEVDRQMLQVAKDSNLKDVSALEQAMREQGIDPGEVRTVLRGRLLRQYVLQQEVLQPLLSGGGSRDQAEAARKTYLKKLREEAFIKINLG